MRFSPSRCARISRPCSTDWRPPGASLAASCTASSLTISRPSSPAPIATRRLSIASSSNTPSTADSSWTPPSPPTRPASRKSSAAFPTVARISSAGRAQHRGDRREAHRSQYDFIDGFARHMRDALPQASFIGFTGTPIELADANTRAVFGDYISVYDIQRAVQDGATVPIYYESRLAKIVLDEEQRPKLDPD